MADSEGVYLTISDPDDFHLHLRDNDALPLLVPHAAAQFRRAIVMPNLRPPVRTAEEARAYRRRILAHVPPQYEFEPLMTLYLTDNTTPQDIIDAAATGFVYACKLYPAGATTNSDSGVTNIEKMYPVFEQMAKSGLRLLIHGEVTNPGVDIFDREDVFIEEVMKPLVASNPDNLQVVMEHITTAKAVDFISKAPSNVGATITAHHLLKNRNHIFINGITPWLYCLPIMKKESDRQALLNAATSGNPKFFAGTDSAPHEKDTKECCFGHAGIYTSHAAISLYAQAFQERDALNMLDDFVSKFGAQFYDLPRNRGKTTIRKQSWKVPEFYPYRKVKGMNGMVDGSVRPFWSNDILDFQTKRTEKAQKQEARL